MISPLGDRVLIKPDANPTETESGLHLVEHRKPETMGTVIETSARVHVECPNCGHDCSRSPAVMAGDTVLFSWQSGQEIFLDDERYLLMREDDILAVLEGVN